jgi:hypothetical protein
MFGEPGVFKRRWAEEMTYTFWEAAFLLVLTVILSCMPLVHLLQRDPDPLGFFRFNSSVPSSVQFFAEWFAQLTVVVMIMRIHQLVQQLQARVRLADEERLELLYADMLQKRARARSEDTDEAWASYRASTRLYENER